MIDAIVGLKGSGKTAALVNEISAKATSEDANIVCLEYGRRFNHNIPYQVRLIDITEYPVASYSELLAFIAGVSAQDHDITHIYIDSLYKVANDSSLDNLSRFVDDLDKFAVNIEANFTITISEDPSKLPDNVKKIVRK